MKIREKRLRAGISQEALARALGISAKTIHRWENGKSEPTGLYKKAIEEFFKEKKGI